MLKVKRLHPDAKLPTVAHPGTDLCYDLYALEDIVLPYGVRTIVRTGISAEFTYSGDSRRKFGLLIQDRSSMAANGIVKSAGVIDHGYTGELMVILTNTNVLAAHQWCGLYGYDVKTNYPYATESRPGFLIRKGQKVSQMLPTEVFTAESIIEVDSLDVTARGAGGFGSTGV